MRTLRASALRVVPVVVGALLLPCGLEGQDSARSPSGASPQTSAEMTGPLDSAELGAFLDDFFERELAESNIPGAVFLMVGLAVFLLFLNNWHMLGWRY